MFVRTEDQHERESVELLPDLVNDWPREVVAETVWSPKSGLAYAPVDHWGAPLVCDPGGRNATRLCAHVLI
jgi:hypothetical protein